MRRNKRIEPTLQTPQIASAVEQPWRRPDDIPLPDRVRPARVMEDAAARAPAAPTPAGPSYPHDDRCTPAKQRPADQLDEACMESFPCSDPPAICRADTYIPAWQVPALNAGV